MSGSSTAQLLVSRSAISMWIIVASIVHVLVTRHAYGSPVAPQRARELAPQLVVASRSDRVRAPERTLREDPTRPPALSLDRALRVRANEPSFHAIATTRAARSHAQRTRSLFVYLATSLPLGRRVDLQLGVRRRPDRLAAESRALLGAVTNVRFAVGLQVEL